MFFPPGFNRAAAMGVGEDIGKASLGVLWGCDADQNFNWKEDRRPRHESDLVIYEMQVRGFTMNPNSEGGLTSAELPTRAKAIAEAKRLHPHAKPNVARVEATACGRPDKFRKVK